MANLFLWSNIEIRTRDSFLSLIATLVENRRMMNFGRLIRQLTLNNIPYIDKDQWDLLLESCPKLLGICLERCMIEANDDPPIENYPDTITTFVMSDSPMCPVQPILNICIASKGITRLQVSGCNFTEKDMCKMVSLTPRLKDIKLGSHAGASLTAIGNAGGNDFAKSLAENCPLLIGADLTGKSFCFNQ